MGHPRCKIQVCRDLNNYNRLDNNENIIVHFNYLHLLVQFITRKFSSPPQILTDRETLTNIKTKLSKMSSQPNFPVWCLSDSMTDLNIAHINWSAVCEPRGVKTEDREARADLTVLSPHGPSHTTATA